MTDPHLKSDIARGRLCRAFAEAVRDRRDDADALDVLRARIEGHMPGVGWTSDVPTGPGYYWTRYRLRSGVYDLPEPRCAEDWHNLYGTSPMEWWPVPIEMPPEGGR